MVSIIITMHVVFTVFNKWQVAILHRLYKMFFSVASFTNCLAIITFCFLQVHSVENATSPKPPQASYNYRQAQQLYLLLQKPGLPLKSYTSITNRMEQELIPNEDETEYIKGKLKKVPGGIGIYPKGFPCSFFIQQNMDEAMRTAKYLKDIPALDEFLKTCTILRDLVNEEIYIFASINSMIFRNDTKNIPLPSIENMFPQWYIPGTVLEDARRQVESAETETEPIVLEYTFEKSNYSNPEDKLAYFREDINLNSQHFYWHQFYPPSYSRIFDSLLKDRKGELFFYLHRQYIARYDAERACANLSNVTPIENWTIPLAEGYDSKLLNSLTGDKWLARDPNRTIVDVPSMDLYITDLDRILINIYNVVDSGTLPPSEALSIIGDITEPNRLSDYYNESAYGNYHGSGHLIISRCQNPNDSDPQAKPGVMYDIPVSMRDPSFYKWHKHIDDIAYRYQNLLTPYTNEELSIPNVTVANISVFGATTVEANVLTTFWQKRQVSVQDGLDFAATNPVIVNVVHLQHEPFSYNITIVNADIVNITVTVRIFIAPKYNIDGNENTFEQLRRLFISMDTFLATAAPGEQTILRESRDSNLTIPPGLSFEQLGNLTRRPNQDNYCGCGWPDHLLLPMGRVEGMTFLYVVMLSPGTDYNEVYSDTYGCVTAPTLCGILGEKYPDSRAMGYPFDRKGNDSALTISAFADRPNMKISEIVIKHVK